VPEDFKGKYQIIIDVDLGPFETQQEEMWYSIE